MLHLQTGYEKAALRRSRTDIAKVEKLVSRAEWKAEQAHIESMRVISALATSCDLAQLAKSLQAIESGITGIKMKTAASPTPGPLQERDVERLLVTLLSRNQRSTSDG